MYTASFVIYNAVTVIFRASTIAASKKSEGATPCLT